ncbi:MAG: methyltransferase domain-containing protein [Saprospiraceae bacterium]
MNFKMLFPSYRNRFLFIKNHLKNIDLKNKNLLNIGCGEGDYDPHLAKYVREIHSIDVNQDDLNFAQVSNASFKNICYQKASAMDLPFEDASFDVIISVDTLEHVGEPEKMLQEISRVVRPDGKVYLTFPTFDFPITYDPINFFRQKKGLQPIKAGAYAFNHIDLPKESEVNNWLTKAGLKLVKKEKLSGWLIGLLEMYWTGWIQSTFKANASNMEDPQKPKKGIRSGYKIPRGVFLTDLVLLLDNMVSINSKRSVGVGLILKKNNSN